MLAPRIKEMLDEAHELDQRCAAQATMLDRTFDLHNDLTDWATTTEHGEAAMEVMAILEVYASLRVEDFGQVADSLTFDPENAA